MLELMKREIKSCLTSLYIYLYYASFFLVIGIFFVKNCLETSSTEFGYFVLSRGFLVVLFFLPIWISKRFREQNYVEKESLETENGMTFSVLVSKSIICYIFLLIPVVLSILYPLLISICGTISFRFTFASYLAMILLVSVFYVMDVFIATLIKKRIIRLLVFYLVYGWIIVLRMLEGIVSNKSIASILRNSSILNKYNDMASGIIRSYDVLYLLSYIFVFLFAIYFVNRIKKVGIKKSIGQIAVVLVLVILCNFVGIRKNVVFDMTAECVVTLSDESKAIVQKNEKPIMLYYLGQESRVNATYKELLNAYQKANDKIKVVYIDILKDDAFQKEYLHDISDIHEASLLVVSDEQTIYLDSSDYAKEIYVTSYTKKTISNLESQITNAIYCVGLQEKEMLVSYNGSGEEAMPSLFRNTMLLNNYKELVVSSEEDLLSMNDLQKASVLFLNGPQEDYSIEVLNVLRDYVEQGGNIFLAIDPLNENLPNLYDFLKEYGMSIQSGVVIERTTGTFLYDTPYYLVPYMKDTAYSNDCIDDRDVVITMTSKGVKEVDTENGYEVLEVLKTSTEAFSKIDNFDKVTQKGIDDIMGSFGIGVVSHKEGRGSLFLLTSNLFFQEEVDQEANGANRKFFTNVLDELTGREEGIMIKEKVIGTQTANYPIQASKILKIIVICVIPAMWLICGGAGVLVAYRKKRKGEQISDKKAKK